VQVVPGRSGHRVAVQQRHRYSPSSTNILYTAGGGIDAPYCRRFRFHVCSLHD
jgi:hypothetical protein